MIIKCPECGHQVSDKAPICLSCGVQIAGHLVKCGHCGILYLKEDEHCPNCHRAALAQKEEPNEAKTLTAQNSDQSFLTPTPQQPQSPNREKQSESKEEVIEGKVINTNQSIQKKEKEEEKKNNHLALLVSFLLALLIGVILIYFYKENIDANQSKQEITSEFQSDNIDELQKYLDENPNLPLSESNRIKQKLELLRKGENEWRKVTSQNTFAAYKNYLDAHPETERKDEILSRMDDLAWKEAKATNTEEGYLNYKTRMPNGKYNKMADEKLKVMLDNTASAEEQSAALSTVRNFLRGINAKDASKITETIGTSFSFLGENNANVASVQRYIREKLYQADVKKVNWHLGDPIETTTEKTTNGNEQHIAVAAKLVIEREGGTHQKGYTIRAVIKDKKILSISWTSN